MHITAAHTYTKNLNRRNSNKKVIILIYFFLKDGGREAVCAHFTLYQFAFDRLRKESKRRKRGKKK